MTAALIALTLPTSATPMPEAAMMYATCELAPLPLYGITSDGRCQCGDDECPKRSWGKHPIGDNWQGRATTDPDKVRDRFRSHRGNIGIYLASGGLVLIDADGELGLETARTWGLPETLTQQSGSGVGAHYIYRLGEHQDASAITDRKVAPGLDVKVRGQFVAAPSRHASGGQYAVTLAVAPATLPDWLYARIRKEQPPLPPPPVPSDDPSTLYDRAKAYVDAIPPAIAGSGGHDQTFGAARAIAGWLEKGLPESQCLALLTDYSARCQPPWTAKELAHKWNDAKNARRKPTLADRPRLRVVQPGETPPPTDEPPPDDYRSKLMYADSRKGKPKLISHIDNVIRILQLAPEWQGRLGFDEFSFRTLVSGAPWDEYQRPTTANETWTDEDGTRLCAWLRRHFQRDQFNPSVLDCERAVDVVARAHSFHPVRDYLDSVTWDGTARLGSWLSTYLGAEDNEYHRMVGSWWLISAVARIYQPGCKVDTVPILEGPQGARKSTALRTLAGAQFFSDTPIDIGNKDAYQAIQGCWFVELAELDSLMRAEASRAKAFFSSGTDRYRPTYGRRVIESKRQCVFVGTVNLSEYLSDPTGARRFHPIACGAILIDDLERDRDQLWAEAVHEYREGRPWYPQAADAVSQLAERQSERTREDAWAREIRTYAERQGLAQVTMSDVLSGALRMDPKDWTPSVQTRVGIVMVQQLRWAKCRIRDGQKLMWAWRAPGT